MIQSLPIDSPSYFHDAVRSKFPIIVDDLESSPFGLSFEGKRHEDLLTCAGLAHIYAGDRKSTPPHAHDTPSSDSDNMYVAHPQSGLAQHQLQHFDIPYSQAEDASYSTAIFPEERQADGAPPYNGLRARHPMPEVTDWTPHEGTQGTNMMVMLVSAYEVDPTWQFEMQFGDQVAPCTVTMTSLKGVYYELALSVDVPQAPETVWTNPKVALILEAKDTTGTSMGMATLGGFTYQGFSRRDSTQSSPQLSRKRRLSLDVEESMPAKRLATKQMRAASESAYEQQPFGYLTQSPSLLALDGNDAPSPRNIHRQSSSVPTSAPSHLQRGSPRTPSWTPTTGATASPQPGGASRKANGLSPIVVNPKLCRTTTLQQSPSPSATPIATPVGFNPYAMLPYNKAMLKVNGDLEEMTRDWTETENDAGRRLVHFWRNQTGSTINASFKPVTPEDRQPSFICISCIWWEAKEEHFVTSVDTIYLLENLVGGRFTVEEKNRIRRNLEGFRPLTVSKGKSDSEDFFKLIMGFPNPKPRNIEKDVKVFPWKILGHALKKIMGKYSASYSSMASALPQTASAPAFAGVSEIQGLMGNPAMSPATHPHAHAHAHPHPHPHAHPHAHVSSAEAFAAAYETGHLIDHRVSMASMPPSYASMVTAISQPASYAVSQPTGYAMYGYAGLSTMGGAGHGPMASPPAPMMPQQRPPPPQHAHTHPLPASHPAYAHTPGSVGRPASSASWDFSATGTPFVESPVTVSNGLDVTSHTGGSGVYYTMPATDA